MDQRNRAGITSLFRLHWLECFWSCCQWSGRAHEDCNFIYQFLWGYMHPHQDWGIFQLQFCEAMRILFEHKESKNNIIYSTILLHRVFHHFREYHNAYASVNNADYADYVHARAFPPECKQRWLRQLRSWILSKMSEDVTRGRRIVE